MIKPIKSILLTLLLLIAVCGLWTVSCVAENHLISYQGKLINRNGTPLPDGNYDLTFTIYDNSGTSLWEETHTGVNIRRGIFSVLLGSVKSLDLTFANSYFLETKVNNEVMSPRRSIVSVGYAIKANLADNMIQAQYADKAKVADTITDPSFLVPRGGIIMCKSGCPSGYRRLSELDGKFLVPGQNYNAAAGGSNQKALTVNNLPAHSHDISHSHSVVTKADSGPYNKSTTYNLGLSAKALDIFIPVKSLYSGSTGSGQSFDVRPEFATVVLCEKE